MLFKIPIIYKKIKESNQFKLIYYIYYHMKIMKY